MPPPGSLKKVPIDEKELETVLEAQFSLPKAETRTYIQLVQKGGLTIHETAEFLKLTEQEAERLLKNMEARGLVIVSPESASLFAPLHPRMTLTNIFKMYEKEVVQGLRDRRATVDRVVNLLTPIFEENRK